MMGNGTRDWSMVEECSLSCNSLLVRNSKGLTLRKWEGTVNRENIPEKIYKNIIWEERHIGESLKYKMKEFS